MWKIVVLVAVCLVIRDSHGHKWRNGRHRHVSVCEHRNVKMFCGRHSVIRVHYAMYGRLNRHTCAKLFTWLKPVNCKAKHSTGIAKKLCNGKRLCTLHASNSVFGDPCHGTHKYLEVKYMCKWKRHYHYHHRHGRAKDDNGESLGEDGYN